MINITQKSQVSKRGDERRSSDFRVHITVKVWLRHGFMTLPSESSMGNQV